MKKILIVVAIIASFIFGIHAGMFVPVKYERFFYIHDDWSDYEALSSEMEEFAPIYELNEVVMESPPIQKSIKEGYGEPIQQQIQIQLDTECLDQLEYYEGEQKRGDEDPFVNYRVQQLKDRCD